MITPPRSFAWLAALFLTVASCDAASKPGATRSGRSGGSKCANTNPTTAAASVRERKEPASGTRIVVRPTQTLRPISPLVFGVNHRYPYNGFDMWDPDAGRPYPRFLDRYRFAKFTAIRFPGGRTANNYHWKRAIGPIASRGRHVDSAFGRIPAYVEPLTNEYGPDEFGQTLEETRSEGSIVVNFTTGSAREAADWVEYMNAPVGANPNGGTAWARERADNGHPEPYGIKYWEVGNELAGKKSFWLGPEATAEDKAAKYAFGGSTEFVRDSTVKSLDYSAGASVSTGDPAQSFYVRFPPVVAGTDTVYVDGDAWTRVNELSGAGRESAYEIDYDSGRITFGDGRHGRIPPEGAEITISHVSGPHDGFVDFYREMKAVDPAIEVGAAFNNEFFLQLMGAEYPYDFFVTHSYSFFHDRLEGIDNLHDLMMTLPDDQASKLAGVKRQIATYAGPNRARDIELVVSEWAMSTGKDLGIQRVGGPDVYPQSLDGAIYVALVLKRWIELGVLLAEKHSVVDIDPRSPPPGYDKPKSAFQALIGPHPCYVLSPAALAFRLLTEMTGDMLVASEVTGNPTRSIFNGTSLASLVTLASTDGSGNVYLVVVNRDRTTDVTATIDPEGFPTGRRAEVWTLGANSYLATNTVEKPNRVAITETEVTRIAGNLTLEFPAHSITGIHFAP